MEFDRPLRVVTSAVDGDILDVLARADHEFTIADLARRIPSRSSEGIRLAMDRLIAQGIISIRQVGPSRAYGLNRAHLAAAPIIALAEMPARFRERLTERIAEWPEQPVYAAVFGSTARGDARSDSDIDLFLVRPDDATETWAAQVDALSSAIVAWTGNDARPLEFSRAEVVGAARAEGVIRDVLRDGITVAGDRGAFHGLVGRAS